MTTALEVSDFADLVGGYLAPSCTVHGSARSAIFRPAGCSLWQVVAELDAGAELGWGTEHGDEALYVVKGMLEVDGGSVSDAGARAGGAILVEADAEVTVRARESTRLVHCGPVDPRPPADGLLGPPALDGRGVHVFASAADAPSLRGHEVTGTYFADGTCPTCRVALFVADARDIDHPHDHSSHCHSQDEIVHVLDGVFQFGPVTVAAGMSVAVPAYRRYGFRTAGGYRMLNYRRDVSTSIHHGAEPLLETVEALTPMFPLVDPDAMARPS